MAERIWALSPSERAQRVILAACSFLVILYSGCVLWVVASSGDIGLRCVLDTIVRRDIAPEYTWRDSDDPQQDSRPGPGAELTQIGGRPIRYYTDYVMAQRAISRMPSDGDHQVEVAWREGEREYRALATVQLRPYQTYVWSVFWFLQELLIFLVGARVYWKRPRDLSAKLFFWLCIVSVGAYMGGYHWTEIVVEPRLIYPFVLLALFVPIVSLHFYLIFPRLNPIYLLHRRKILWTLYGVPTVYLLLIWAGMYWSRMHRLTDGVQVALALGTIRNLAFGYIGLAAFVFALCFPCLLWSFRTARNRAERNQAKYLLMATCLSLPLVGYLLTRAAFEPATLGLDEAAWPMYVVSLFYTLAYALSITRYKLMQAEEIINRSAIYFAVSVAAGLAYTGLVVVGTLIVGARLQAEQSSREGLVVGITAIVILILSGVARDRFLKAIDRRFYREKYKLDQAMRKMSLAVGSLVDRETLGRRLLEAAAEVLRLEWGAIYFASDPGGPLRLVACHGPEPDDRELDPANPLVERLRTRPTIRVAHAMAIAGGSDPSTDAMIALGGEAAGALELDGDLAGVLVLGPKRSGLPFEDEELSFLGALGSIATLALHSAGIQRTLEELNVELRDKVDKIAEMQRRIMILQDQLVGRSDSEPESETPERPVAPETPGAFERIKGSSPAVRRLIDVAQKVSASPSAVLIRGESGTGKELLAEAIHRSSPRSGGPFVKVHCAALSSGLLESELFGHVKGAFTGADRDRVGRFEQANGGTLFLDEIGDINLEVQTKLLRVLQQMEFERVGSSQSIRVDVRLVAATHQDLEALIRAGRFREDLFYRLNVISLRVPPLRERPEDVFELAVHFLRLHARRAGKPVSRIDDGAIEALMAYAWPGNIRELENVIERAVVLADGVALGRDDLPAEISQGGGARRRSRVAVQAGSAWSTPERRRSRGLSEAPALPAPAREPEVEEWDAEFIAFERRRLLDALAEAGGNKSEAARLLAMPRSTFFSKLKKHGLA